MIYKVYYIYKEMVNAYLPTEHIEKSEKYCVEIEAKNVNEAKEKFEKTHNSNKLFITQVVRSTPKHKSRGAKANPKEVAKREAKKQLKKEKNLKWLEKHPESNLAKKIKRKEKNEQIYN